MCKNADPKDEKALKLAEKLGVKLTSEEKEFAGKPLLKVGLLLPKSCMQYIAVICAEFVLAFFGYPSDDRNTEEAISHESPDQMFEIVLLLLLKLADLQLKSDTKHDLICAFFSETFPWETGLDTERKF